ncbi:hypothetical protein MKX03_034941, partial [Papaver bracteatum]
RLRNIAEFIKSLQDCVNDPYQYHLLTPSNYQDWKKAMKYRLKDIGLWYCVKHPGDNFVSDRDAEAFATIKMYCGIEMLPHIMYTDDPKEAWNLLAQADAASPEEK